MTAIILRCKRCGRKMKYSRKADPDLPTNVATIESSACDRCGNGDFGSETWLDADGLEVSQDIYDDDGEVQS
ncbi:MAG: hypothetical protein E5X86_19645 [Mesorhizobium sp.]|uniref:hypothetical protein n=1 Tax=Mesorhizobium sp. TaxID=1871066 RepID=UPI000FE5EA83|nr:hypothetical protein [Mesorhizobium sp.]RWL14843.1 MAG: hypothetical protein EOR57_31350 [Mesorhizobium sp.]TIO15587.1 MAG: hypothetical protein E5X86_19645 [Mesorhizobium sp.]